MRDVILAAAGEAADTTSMPARESGHAEPRDDMTAQLYRAQARRDHLPRKDVVRRALKTNTGSCTRRKLAPGNFRTSVNYQERHGSFRTEDATEILQWHIDQSRLSVAGCFQNATVFQL